MQSGDLVTKAGLQKGSVSLDTGLCTIPWAKPTNMRCCAPMGATKTHRKERDQILH